MTLSKLILTKNNGYCEALLEFMWAEEIKAMEVSDYEGAELIQDLNQPIQASILERFTEVVDGGSVEDVFNIV